MTKKKRAPKKFVHDPEAPFQRPPTWRYAWVF